MWHLLETGNNDAPCQERGDQKIKSLLGASSPTCSRQIIRLVRFLELLLKIPDGLKGVVSMTSQLAGWFLARPAHTKYNIIITTTNTNFLLIWRRSRLPSPTQINSFYPFVNTKTFVELLHQLFILFLREKNRKDTNKNL